MRHCTLSIDINDNETLCANRKHFLYDYDPMQAPMRCLSHLLILCADRKICCYCVHIAPVVALNDVSDDGPNGLRSLLP